MNARRSARASKTGYSLRLDTQQFFEHVSKIAANQTTFPTYIPPASLVQQRLANNVSTSTIQLIYQGKVPQRVRSAFRYAANIWQTLISSRVPIKIQVSWQKDKPFILGGAAPSEYWRDFRGAVRRKTWHPVALANKLAGKDLNPKLPDGYINLNRRQSWYVGTDGNVPSGQYDLVTVALHEIYHVIRSSDFITYDFQTGEGTWKRGQGFPGLYDRFTLNGSGQRLLDTKQFPNPSRDLGRQLTSNNLFLDAPNAVNANNGLLPKLFAPNSWLPGSSYSHLDEATYGRGTSNSLITPAFGLSEAIHSPGPIAVGILKDMGWNRPL